MDIDSTLDEIDLHIFSLARRNNEWKVSKKKSETIINEGKLVMNQKNRKSVWNDEELHLTQSKRI